MNRRIDFYTEQAREQGRLLKGRWPQQHSADTLSLKCPLCFALVELHDKDAHLDWHKALFKLITVAAGDRL